MDGKIKMDKLDRMLDKNKLIDIIDNFKDGCYRKRELIWLLEYELGIRDSIVLLGGESDEEFASFLTNNYSDYILFNEGRIIVCKEYSKLKLLLDNIDSEYKLGILLGYPECCVKKWCSLKDGIETSKHKNRMGAIFDWLPYTPCSKDCKESLIRQEKIMDVVG